MKMSETFMDLVFRYKRDTGNWPAFIGLPTGDYLNLAADLNIRDDKAKARIAQTPLSLEYRKVQVGPSFNVGVGLNEWLVVMEVKP
jgi:hypothetical protein